MKVEKLGLSEKDKKGFLYMRSPKSVPEVAGEIGCQYDTAYKKIKVWLAKNWLIRQTCNKEYTYHINQDVIEL